MSLEDFKYNLRSLKKCNQYWDEMKPVIGGRMCGKCVRKIVDFSQMTHTEIAVFMSESKEPVCGFYLPGQLPQWQRSRTLSMAVGFSTLIAGSITSQAQTTPESPHAIVNKLNHARISTLQHQSISVNQADSVIIRGMVMYIENNSRQRKPVAFASVIIKGTKTGVACNEEGVFRLKCPASADGTIYLVVSAITLETKEVAVQFGNNPEYDLDVIILEPYEGDISQFYVTERRPWHKRFWRALTKPFRK